MNNLRPLKKSKDSVEPGLSKKMHNLFYNQALQNIRESKLEAGKDKLMKAITFDDNHEETWNLLGLVYYRLGRYKKASYCWNKSIELDTDNTCAIRYLKEAKEEFATLIPYLEELDGFARAKKYRNAKKLIPRISLGAAFKVDILNYFGIIMGLCNEWEDARMYWIQSLQISKDGMAPVYLADSTTQKKKGNFYIFKLLKRKLDL